MAWEACVQATLGQAAEEMGGRLTSTEGPAADSWGRVEPERTWKLDYRGLFMTELDKEEDVHLFPFLSFQLSVGFCHSFSSSFIDCTPKQKACWREVKQGPSQLHLCWIKGWMWMVLKRRKPLQLWHQCVIYLLYIPTIFTRFSSTVKRFQPLT